MDTSGQFDAIVVGAGPNGLAAGITLARAGLATLILEASEKIGGGTRSEELTLPGFVHDVCSAIHPLTAGSPFFQQLPLKEYGLELIQPPASVAHPFDNGTAMLFKTSIKDTVETLDRTDREEYRRLFGPFVKRWDDLSPDILGPLRFPRNPILMARFGLAGLRSARSLAEGRFDGPRARALFAGLAAHSMIPLEALPSAAYGLVLGITGHAVGWIFPRGGAVRIAETMAAYFAALGGQIRTNHRVENLNDLPRSRVVLLDLTPRQILRIAGGKIPGSYRHRLEKFKYGAGAFKIDWALSEPIPWKAAECSQAGTVHLGGTFDEIARGESTISRGRNPDRPFTLIVQTSLFDDSRAPAGKHTGWAYCHVPNGSDADMTGAIEDQIERFAPGFRDCVMARSVLPPAGLENHNANMVGGDINGGAATWDQLFTRPTVSLNPYRTALGNVYICSSSTPPGGGVHGMCGYHAARTALSDLGIRDTTGEIAP